MRVETGIERVRCELIRALDQTRADLDRVEIWTAAMSAFSRPVPDYEPSFRHMRELKLTTHELD